MMAYFFKLDYLAFDVSLFDIVYLLCYLHLLDVHSVFLHVILCLPTKFCPNSEMYKKGRKTALYNVWVTLDIRVKIDSKHKKSYIYFQIVKK